jgi:D-alanyl-D-alanine carboxypeptidase
MPTTLPEFTPSPESQWSSVYLKILGTDFEALDLNIEYTRSWQQTGGFTRDLKQGSRGQDVKLMQYLLHKFNPSFGVKNITGSFGVKTAAALASLQKTLNIKPTGQFNEETRYFFDSVYFKELCPDSDPAQDKSYENVSRRTSVPLDYIPSDLIRLPRTVRTVGVMCLSREPAKRLEEMFIDAALEGHSLAVFSAYRSAKTQDALKNYYLKSLGKVGLAGVAEAGHSEHQLGTTVDISGKSIRYAGPSQKFATTPEGKWLAEHSYKYGFILSYPQGKQQDTGYIFEPWHFRYVGVDTARDIFEEKLTIQEYFDLVRGNSQSFENQYTPGE